MPHTHLPHLAAVTAGDQTAVQQQLDHHPDDKAPVAVEEGSELDTAPALAAEGQVATSNHCASIGQVQPTGLGAPLVL